jgi:hypothetical protein
MAQERSESRVDEAGFSIRILEQGWVKPEMATTDLCSHGRLALSIGGQQIPTDDVDGYGVSEAALALLRTLASDHLSEHSRDMFFLIPHGCGFLMWSCPNSFIDWSVEHVDTGVRVYNVSDPSRSFDVDVIVAADVYAAEVIAFATEAKTLFEGIEKHSDDDDWEWGNYLSFWEEYDSLLASAQESLPLLRSGETSLPLVPATTTLSRLAWGAEKWPDIFEASDQDAPQDRERRTRHDRTPSPAQEWVRSHRDLIEGLEQGGHSLILKAQDSRRRTPTTVHCKLCGAKYRGALSAWWGLSANRPCKWGSD